MHCNAIPVFSLLIFFFLRPKDDFIRILKEKHHRAASLKSQQLPRGGERRREGKKPHCLGCHLKGCSMAAGSHMTGSGLKGGIRKPEVSGKLI